MQGPWLEDSAIWQRIARRLSAGDPALAGSARDIFARADAAALAPAESVVDKVKRHPKQNPSTDPHDYVSIATYWWPNPHSPDGLPYIQRDGELTPDTPLYDRLPWDRTAERISALCTASIVKPDDKRYPTHAMRHLKAWFLDPATRMNPHLRHAQFIPGRSLGRAIGVIDLGVRLPLLLDRVALFRQLRPDACPVEVIDGLNQWLDPFLTWYLRPEIRETEGDMDNNHGVFYDRMVAYLALTLGRKKEATACLSAVFDRRVLKQVEPDGSMPRELARTLSLSYSLLNLGGLIALARLGKHLGIEVWNRSDAQGRSIAHATTFLYESLCRDAPWPHPQIHSVEPLGVLSTFQQTHAFSDRFDLKALRRIDGPRDPDAVLLQAPLHPFR